jgi:hypothetical protein
MTKSITEFKEELKALRQEMRQNANRADSKLVASWIDKLVISLEGFTETLEMIDNELEITEECCEANTEACCCCESEPKKAKPAKKAAKAKPAKKKRR